MNRDTTVVIPSFNRSNELLATIPSYYKSPRVFQIIIVDNGSTDDTESIIESFIKLGYPIKLIRLSVRAGAARARIVGLSYVSTKFTLLGEDDVYLQDDYIDKLHIILEKYKCDLATGGIINGVKVNNTQSLISDISSIKFDEINSFPHDLPPLYVKEVNRLDFQMAIKVPYSHIIILGKTELMKCYVVDDKFNNGNGYREDTDFILTLRKKGAELYFTKSTYCFHLRGIFSKSGGQRGNKVINELRSIYNTTYLLKKHWAILSTDFNFKGCYLTVSAHYIVSRFIQRFKTIVKLIFPTIKF